MQSNDSIRTFNTGSVRDGGKKPALHLISPHALNCLGEWLRFACEDRKPHPYPKRNWEKGQPYSEIIASLLRHANKIILGDESEDHIAAVLFGGMALAHFREEIKAGRLPSSLDDLPRYVTKPRQLSTSVEDSIQAKLDATFKDPSAVYAAEPIRAGQEAVIPTTGFAYLPEHAYLPLDDPASTAILKYTLAQAIEDIPAGAPVKVTQPVQRGDQPTVTCDPPQSIQEAAGLATCGVDVGSPEGDEAIWARIDAAKDGDVISVNRIPGPRCRPFTVYLCGPITGQEVDFLWRQAATVFLNSHGIKTLNPLRGKAPHKISDQGMGYAGSLASTEMADRDHCDVTESDLIFAHFPYAPERQSIGSLMEMGGAAIGLGKPIVLCTDVPEFNKHLFTRRFCTIEPDFQTALSLIVDFAGFRAHRAYNAIPGETNASSR
jgi:hypothetical protein